MKHAITALALVASVTAFTAPAANAMGEELTMLEAAVENAFNQLGVEDVDPSMLTLAQLALIRNVITSEDNTERARDRIMAIVNR